MRCLRCLTYNFLALGVLLGCPAKSQDGDTDTSGTSSSSATATDATAGEPTSTVTTDTSTTDTSTTDTSTTDTSTTDTTTTTTTAGPIEPSGTNPCGACAPGEFCFWTPSDQEACEEIECRVDNDETCTACTSAPTECDPEQLAQCAAWKCLETELLGFSVAEDGVLVVQCDIWADTGCGS